MPPPPPTFCPSLVQDQDTLIEQSLTLIGQSLFLKEQSQVIAAAKFGSCEWPQLVAMTLFWPPHLLANSTAYDNI